jgi:hypothetical protein
MNIKHALVINRDNEPMKVRVTEMEKPQYRATASEAECDEYKKNYDLWEGSFEEYLIFDEEFFEDLSRYNYLGNLGNLHPDWYDDIRVGIEVKVDNIAIEQLCMQTGKPCGFPCNGEDNCARSLYAVFKKSPVITQKDITYITLQELLLKLSKNKEISVGVDMDNSILCLNIKDWHNKPMNEFCVDIDLTNPLIDVEPFKPYIK